MNNDIQATQTVETPFTLNDTYEDGVSLYRLITADGEVREYAAPSNWDAGVMVGKSILFECDWTRDSNYTILIRIGDSDNWQEIVSN